MLILAIESSAKAASVALLNGTELIAQYTQCSGLTHSCTLLPMVEDMLRNTATRLEDVELIAVAQGPGSFTGIRIGVSTVKGLAWAAEKSCVGVSTLGAMAWHGVSAGGLICPVMDARRSQVYNALFDIEGSEPVRLTPDRAISLEDLSRELLEKGREVFLVGDGAFLSFDYLTRAGVKCRVAPQNLVYQSAWGVGMQAMREKAGNADDLLPVYLRLSQAERERQARMKE